MSVTVESVSVTEACEIEGRSARMRRETMAWHAFRCITGLGLEGSRTAEVGARRTLHSEKRKSWSKGTGFLQSRCLFFEIGDIGAFVPMGHRAHVPSRHSDSVEIA